jgi:hypothetical protein
MHKALLLTLLFITTNFVYADWNIDKPNKKVPSKLNGEIWGRKFKFGSATINDVTLTIKSKDKLGGWPESELIIFLKKN